MTTARSVHFVLPPEGDAPSGGDRYDRRVVEELPGAGWRVRCTVLPGRWPEPGADDAARLDAALEELPDGRPVVLDGLVACGTAGVLERHAARLPLAVLVHLPLACETGTPTDLARELHRREGQVLRAVHQVLVPSSWTARHVSREHGVAPARITVAPPGADPSAPARGSGGSGALLSVAAVTPMKGHDVLVSALARCRDLDWHCCVAGSRTRAAEHAARVRDDVRARGLADRVRLAGPLRRAELGAAYAASDLVVVPSRAETYGLVVTEALARGLPVVASDVGGVPEALGSTDDGTLPGMLVPPDDPAELARALRRWLTGAGERARLRDAAHRRRGTLNTWRETARQVGRTLEHLST
ncbi:glycosyltransferase family 4 protein [Salinifilum aidingensis]